MENKPDKIIIHHTGNSSTQPQFKQSNEYHRKKFAWQSSTGYFLAYHYFIEQNGEHIQARDELEGAPDELKHNFDGISIGLAGDFRYQLPTKAQMQTLGVICYDIQRKHLLSIADIFLHSDFTPTECPGTNITKTMVRAATINAEVNTIKKIILWILEKIHLLPR